LRRQLRQYPNSSELRAVQVEAAVLRARKGDYDEALAHFARRYRDEPDNSKIASEYLTLLSWSGAHEDAVALYNAHSGEELDDHAREAAASSLLWTDGVEEANGILADLNIAEPDNQRYLRGLALASVARGDSDGAVALLQSIEKAEADTFELLGYLQASQQRPDLAAVAHVKAFALQTPEQRAYLPWFDAVEAAAKDSGIAPFLDDLQQYLPGLAGNPVVARFIVLLLRYDQDRLARQIAAEYPYSAELPEAPGNAVPRKLTLSQLASRHSVANKPASSEPTLADSARDAAPGDRLAKQLQWEAKTASSRFP
jgi:Flp pilus assembly protein TadD